MALMQAQQQKIEAQIEKTTAKISELQAKADQAKADAKIKYYEQIEELSTKQSAAQAKLKELQSSGEDAWDQLRVGAENAFQDLQDAFNRAASKFH